MPFVHKVIIRQVAIISYSPVIQIKLYTVQQFTYLNSKTTVKTKKLAILTFEKINNAKQHVLQKYSYKL